ncbi:MAG: hypothetical protein AB1679_35270 [Actinomycetota bacterium]
MLRLVIGIAGGPPRAALAVDRFDAVEVGVVLVGVFGAEDPTAQPGVDLEVAVVRRAVLVPGPGGDVDDPAVLVGVVEDHLHPLLRVVTALVLHLERRQPDLGVLPVGGVLSATGRV